MSAELSKISEDIEKVASFLEQQIEKQELQKQAGLFAIGDSVICLNPIEGIVKGQKYRITRFTAPNYIAIEDVWGNEIGSFRADRFNKDYNSF